MDNWQTRQSLLMRARNQDDQQAWKDFVSYYENFIKMVLHKMNIQSNDFDDLVQDILVQLWRNLQMYDEAKSKFRTWLSAVIKNKVMSYLNSKTSRENRERINGGSILQHSSDLEQLIEDEWKSYLTKLAMERVSEVFSGKAVEVFKLSMLEYKNDEIAESLEISIDSVYTLKNRVKSRYVKELRLLMEELQF